MKWLARRLSVGISSFSSHGGPAFSEVLQLISVLSSHSADNFSFKKAIIKSYY